MSEDVKINIKFTKEGEAARQAKQEIEDLKTSATAGAGAMRGLQQRTSGLQMVLSSLTMAASGAANGVRGLVTALAGMFQVIVAHPIGRLIAVLAMLGAALYQLYDKFAHAKKGAQELAEEQNKLRENIQALNATDSSFALVQRGLDDIIKKYREASTAAKALQSVQDELADAELAVRLGQLDLEEEQALGAAPDETQRKAIQHQYSQRRLLTRYERESEKAKIEQSERSRAYYAATNERDELQGRMPGMQSMAQTYRDRIKRIEESPELQAGLDTSVITGNKQALKELEETIRTTGERLNALNAEIKNAETAEKAALARRTAIDLEYQKSAARTRREWHQEARTITQGEYAKDQEAAVAFEKEDAETAKTAAAPRVSLAVQQQRTEAESAKIRLQSAQRAAGAKGQSPRQRAASAAGLKTAQQDYYRESAEVAQATAIADKISKATDASSLQALLDALDSIGSSVQQLVQQTTAKANQVASQIKNGGVRTQ